MSSSISEYTAAKALRQKQLQCQIGADIRVWFIHTCWKRRSFYITIIYLDVLAKKYTQSVTKKLPKWVSETSAETRSH